ncbi:MAG: YbaK/EbsC family protein [Candidatus Eisenbacteria bacterium]|nr:YbaK/EbsC family protein [Candidatus Eisenbacteria bacterium]
MSAFDRATPAPLSASAQKVQDAIAARGFPHRVFELEAPVRTAADAARAVGCEVGRIAKSLVFRGARTGRGVLVITSGANRVAEEKVAALLGEPLAKAEPAFVREATGFAIGGVPPLGHATRLETFVDEDLLRYDSIWAAAGHPNALFELRPAELLAMAGGRLMGVR